MEEAVRYPDLFPPFVLQCSSSCDLLKEEVEFRKVKNLEVYWMRGLRSSFELPL